MDLDWGKIAVGVAAVVTLALSAAAGYWLYRITAFALGADDRPGPPDPRTDAEKLAADWQAVRDAWKRATGR